jgi:hypothetical protein
MDKYCKIFISIDTPYQSLISMIEDRYRLKSDGLGRISSDHFDIDFNINEDFDYEESLLFPDGFLYFKYYLDIFFSPNIEDGHIIISMISDLLVWLWENSYPAVAACDYEDLLPEKGGYGSPNIPWP